VRLVSLRLAGSRSKGPRHESANHLKLGALRRAGSIDADSREELLGQGVEVVHPAVLNRCTSRKVVPLVHVGTGHRVDERASARLIGMSGDVDRHKGLRLFGKPTGRSVGVRLLVATGLMWLGTALPYRFPEHGGYVSGWEYVSGSDYARVFYGGVAGLLGFVVLVVGLVLLGTAYFRSLILVAGLACLGAVFVAIVDLSEANDVNSRGGGNLGPGPFVVIAGALVGISPSVPLIRTFLKRVWGSDEIPSG